MARRHACSSSCTSGGVKVGAERLGEVVFDFDEERL